MDCLQTCYPFPTVLSRIIADYDDVRRLCVQIRSGSHENSVQTSYELVDNKEWKQFRQETYDSSLEHQVAYSPEEILYFFLSLEREAIFLLSELEREEKFLKVLKIAIISTSLLKSTETKQKRVHSKLVSLTTPLLHEKSLFLVCGSRSNNVLHYNTVNKTWSNNITPMPLCVHEPACTIADNTLYVVSDDGRMMWLNLNLKKEWKISASSSGVNNCGKVSCFKIGPGILYIGGEYWSTKREIIVVYFYHLTKHTWRKIVWSSPVATAVILHKIYNELVLFTYNDTKGWRRSLTAENFQEDAPWLEIPRLPSNGSCHVFCAANY
jgi:hypothetical protein